MTDGIDPQEPTEIEDKPRPKLVRVWCATCTEELRWLDLQAGRSKYDHQADGPTDHAPVLSMRDPASLPG